MTGRVPLPPTRATRRLRRDLGASRLRGGVTTDLIDRVALAPDASHYLLTPSIIARPGDEREVADVLRVARRHGASVTFRSGGTSLSGQAVTSGVLVDTRRHFQKITVLEDGAAVRVQPGATVRGVNARLLRRGRRFGPDPSSEVACTIGGVIANNSSGMACGTHHNAYRTLRSAHVVLASGTVIDTGAPDADTVLREREPELWHTLARLGEELRSTPELRAEVERQYRIKNTMGYGLNSLLDYEEPAHMLARLLVGSEGTLGFVSEATFDTVPILTAVATGLLVFPSLATAAAAVEPLVTAGAVKIELLDAASLRAAVSTPEGRDRLGEREFFEEAALFVEFEAADEATLQNALAVVPKALAVMNVEPGWSFTSDPGQRGQLWHLRKGLYATVAERRRPGTIALLEDVAVPVPLLGELCSGLQAMFEAHGYDGGVIFGHARDGNIHFMITDDFASDAGAERYRVFTEELVDLVLGLGGTLKAEHGTGRVMAPFVRRQFGDRLYKMMLEIKRAFDPSGILNPDVLISADAEIHLRDFKTTLPVEAEVDGCVECGYCESVCPSRGITTTPRQRIVVRRAIAEASDRGDRRMVRQLEAREDYDSVQTCAVDGMCATVCPVAINTGDLVRTLRRERSSEIDRAWWRAMANVWSIATRAGSAGLSLARRLPARALGAASVVARAVAGDDRIPHYTGDLPAGGPAGPRRLPSGPAPSVVLFSACVNVMFGPAIESDHGSSHALALLLDRAGIGYSVAGGSDGSCCGTPWKSKGMSDGYSTIRDTTLSTLLRASDGGRLPIVCDASSCTEGLAEAVRSLPESKRPRLTFVDAVTFAVDEIVPRLPQLNRLDSVALHPTCSTERMGITPDLRRLASAIATTVTVPDSWNCCGFAGDRGMLHPELTASATAPQAVELAERDFDAHVSCNRTCEIGMTRATGHPYRHILDVLVESIPQEAITR